VRSLLSAWTRSTSTATADVDEGGRLGATVFWSCEARR
jgi:hypothetical protein